MEGAGKHECKERTETEHCPGEGFDDLRLITVLLSIDCAEEDIIRVYVALLKRDLRTCSTVLGLCGLARQCKAFYGTDYIPIPQAWNGNECEQS